MASEIVVVGFCANLSLTLGLPQRKHLAIMLVPTGYSVCKTLLICLDSRTNLEQANFCVNVRSQSCSIP